MERFDNLAAERSKTTFDVRSLTYALYGGKEQTEKWERLSQLVAEDPVFNKEDKYTLSRPEAFKRSLEKGKQWFKRVHELGLNDADARLFRVLVDELMPSDLHHNMFIPALEGQASKEQQAKWLPLAKSYAIIGSYAQTEMGHGSNVQGLETTADFDPTTDEFVLNTPTLTATKWWPGGLGKISTHTMVYARLLIHGKDYGIHAFLTPLRSLEDHTPLPGVKVGDMGVKFGLGAYTTVDNGFLRLHNVRIPRENMLMRFAQVARDGTYTRPPHAKLAYGAMVFVRAGLVEGAGHYLAKAVTIAVRYNALRRQFGPKGQPETQVIDYRTQQHRLFPLLAATYAFHFTGQWMRRLYTDVLQQFAAGDYSGLPEIHASTAGLKALCTGTTADGIEECRKLCGGNGYLMASGLPDLYCAYVPACTYEGDNYILFLQVARYLVKTAAQAQAGERPSGEAEYLGDAQHLCSSNCQAKTVEDFAEPSLLLEALSARAARMIAGAAGKLSQAEDVEKASADSAVEFVRMGRAHCQRIVASKFLEALRQGFAGEGVTEQMRLLCSLFALSVLEANMGDFIEVGYLTPKQAGMAREQMKRLLNQVRPNAVALVDVFAFSDHYLNSALGRYDGDVYTDLYARAQKEPLNEQEVVDGYVEHIRPLVKQQVLSRRSKL